MTTTVGDPRAKAFVQDRTACWCEHERRAHIFGDGACTVMTRGAGDSWTPCACQQFDEQGADCV